MTSNILDLIGNTPLLNINGSNIFAKAEFLNPGGSIKDRIALAMIEAAEKKGELNKHSIIVEPTSGNTGIGLALVGKLKGYKVKIVMPENMSTERQKLIRMLGAELVLTPAEKNVQGAIDQANIFKSLDPNVYIPNQFENIANPLTHYNNTAQEIWRQLKGNIHCFISGIGSGGTIQGIAKYLKEQDPNIKIIAVEPKNHSAILGQEPGLHQLQGIGDGFIPQILDTTLIDEVIEIEDDNAIKSSLELGRNFGILVGISSGANYWAAKQYTKSIKGNIVTIMADRAERYFSTSLMSEPNKKGENLLTNLTVS
ncbi:MAG: cysteine synthase A [Bacteroidales bacterium]|nr:cysteine synthase A [Bacteroidales bacterium]